MVIIKPLVIPWEQVVLRKLGSTNHFHKRLIFISLDVKHFITRPLSTMEQMHFPTFLFFLLFLTLSLANNKGTREFRKSFVEEFYPRWATQRAESAVRINIFLLKKRSILLAFSASLQSVLRKQAGMLELFFWRWYLQSWIISRTSKRTISRYKQNLFRGFERLAIYKNYAYETRSTLPGAPPFFVPSQL